MRPLPTSAAPHWRRVVRGILTLTFAAQLTTCHAAECGDDIGGARVPCACGDTVVVDTTLRSTDAVVRGRCPMDGLVVDARPSSETLVLDLDGLSIVGSGVGSGIDVESGGSEGAAIVGGNGQNRGEVVGFGVGIRIRAVRAIRRIEAVEVKGNRDEGILLRTAGAMLLDVTAARNGGDGIRVIGQGGRLLGIEAQENAGTGVRVAAKDLILEARAERNGHHGIVVSGLRNDLTHSYAGYNRGFGLLLGGARNSTDEVAVEGNTLGGIGSRSAGTRP